MSDQEYLESHGWLKIDPPYNRNWCWRQGKTGAIFQLKDALDCQHGLDKEKGIKNDARRKPEARVSPPLQESGGSAS